MRLNVRSRHIDRDISQRRIGRMEADGGINPRLRHGAADATVIPQSLGVTAEVDEACVMK
jgi:hypothetical protein